MSSMCDYLNKNRLLVFFGVVLLNIITVSVIYYGNGFINSSLTPPSWKQDSSYCQFNNHTCMLQAFQSLAQNYKKWMVDKLLDNFQSWENLPDKFERMNQNPVYRKFNIPTVAKKPKVDIVMIVSSAPARKDRRMAIRETWWQQCQTSKRVSIVCLFMTDAKSSNQFLQNSVIKESEKYKDIRFQNLLGGFDFGRRFLYHMVWALMNYDFKYFMRLDDDYFLCMKKFLDQVIMPPPPLYHWGWVHCIQELVRPEESIILLSRDLMEIYLGQDPYKMLCNRWGDQLLAVWKNELVIKGLYYHHDTRLHHDPPAQQIPAFRTKQNVCHDYIGVHGSYPVQMRALWRNRGKYIHEENVSLSNYSNTCVFPNVMNWKLFGAEFFAEPKTCLSNPDWGGAHGTTYIGRQGSGDG